MRLGITQRLFLSMLAAASLAAVCLFVAVQWSVHRGFVRYLETLDQTAVGQAAEKLERLHREHGSLGILKDDPRRWVRFLLAAGTEEEGQGRRLLRGREPAREPLPPPGLPPPHRRLVVLDAAGARLLGPSGGWRSDRMQLQPVLAEGKAVGWVGMLPPGRALDTQQLRFLTEQKLGLLLSATGVVLLVGLFSLPLARRLVRPLRSLTAATRNLASGRYATRVPVESSDEVGQLARDFNALALALEKNEELRRRWFADVSHELRTPLAVLRGETEALLDGVRQPTAESIASLHGEVLRLTRLVEDLYQLSLSDLGALTYCKEEVDLAGVLAQCLESFRGELGRKGLRLETEVPARGGLPVFGDRERLAQLFTNLLDNSLKHTDAGGRLVVRAFAEGARTAVLVEDSAPGVPQADLGRIFDRLYRADASRSRSTGGAGLGLALCRSIVEAHEGTIRAEPSALGGLRIRVTFPTGGQG